jgi:hypothetical protein
VAVSSFDNIGGWEASGFNDRCDAGIEVIAFGSAI